MPQSYKGYEIPAYTDDADAVKAFQDYTDSVDEHFAGVDDKLDLKDDTTTVNAELEKKADLTGAQFTGTVKVVSGSGGVCNITISSNAPSGGSNGDVWLRY